MPRERHHPPTPVPSEKLLRKERVQQMLSVSPWTLRRMVRDKEITAVRLSPREVRFREQDVMDWISSHTVSATTKEADK
jgi:excisionase family DNA binding protein